MQSNSITGKTFVFAGAVVAVAIVFAALAIAWAIPRTADAAAAGQADKPAVSQITVRGSGSIAAKPDQIRMQVGVAQVETTIGAAQTKISSATAAMVAKLKAAGVADADYRTSQYSVEPIMDYGQGGPKGNEPQSPKLTGFRVVSMLDITLRDAARAPELLDQLVAAGANTIYGINYVFSDPDGLSRQAYNAATQDAEARATKLAGLTNMKLGRIISVTDASVNLPGTVYAKDGLGGGGAGVYPGQQSVQVDVVVTYETTAQ